MSIFNAVIAIIMPILIISALITAIYIWYVNTEKKVSTPTQGTSLLYLDIKIRKVKLIKTAFPFKTFMGMKDYKSWNRISDLMKIFHLSPVVQKNFRDVMHKLDKGSKHESFKFKRSHTNKKITNFTVNITEIDDDSNYLMRVDWNTLTPESRTHHNFKSIEKNDIVMNKSDVKGFVALNINKKTHNVEERLLNLVKDLKCIKAKHIDFFITGGMLVFVFFENSTKNIRKRIERFSKTIYKKGHSRGAGLLFKGSAAVHSSKVYSFKALNQIIQTLDYMIVESIETQTDFVSQIDASRRQEFKNFIEASKLFRQAIKEENIKITKKPVRNRETNRKIMDYVFPKIDSINSVLLDKVLNNTNNKFALMNETARQVAVKTVMEKPVLIDVTSEWLIDNVDKMKYKKAIYVINYNQDRPSNELGDVISKLRKKEFTLALKIYKYNEEIIALIKRMNPQFLVISEEMKQGKKLFDSYDLVGLMSIKYICDSENIKMIYEGSQELMDEKVAKQIGLKFYY